MMDIGTRIRLARKAKKLSQRALGKLLHVSGGAVAQWELNETAPTLQHRVDLCNILGIEIADLLPEAEHLEPILVSASRTVLLVRQFEELPVSVQEGFLMSVLALVAAMKGKPPA